MSFVGRADPAFCIKAASLHRSGHQSFERLCPTVHQIGYATRMTNEPFTPVPVQERIDGWTPARQWGFIQTLADTASVAQAARSVGMSVSSAHRLRRHPAAEGFRAAWEAAIEQNWGRLEQVALERALQGEVEILERNGYEVGLRRRPCSDRLLIHLLQARERQKQIAAAPREAARRQRAAAARQAALGATGIYATAAAPAPAPAPESPAAPEPALAEAASETAAMQRLHNLTHSLPDSRDWEGPPSHAVEGEIDAPQLPMPMVGLAPADGRLAAAAGPTRMRLRRAESGGIAPRVRSVEQ